jgi:carbon-monoxide dehydrogenase medium subunit
MAFRLARPRHLVDINGIEALKRLAVQDGKLCIGAGVRHAAFERAAEPGPLGALLSKVVRHIAHQPIRTRGTFCGSIAHADPASEWCAVAAALDAEMVARSTRGARVIAAKDFFQGIMTTALAEDELLAEVRLPLLPSATRVGFSEFNRRAGDFAIAMAVAVYRVEGGKIADARIAVGGVETFSRRLPEAERALDARAPDAAAFAAAAEAAAKAVDPLDDANTSAAYRCELTATVVRRALAEAGP